jgi:hypothetical protein
MNNFKVLSNKIMSFSNSLVNIFRLNCFKTAAPILKKIKKPTPKNVNSKRSLKSKQRVQMRKMKKLKRNEKKIQKKLVIKDSLRKMDIEAK